MFQIFISCMIQKRYYILSSTWKFEISSTTTPEVPDENNAKHNILVWESNHVKQEFTFQLFHSVNLACFGDRHFAQCSRTFVVRLIKVIYKKKKRTIGFHMIHLPQSENEVCQ